MQSGFVPVLFLINLDFSRFTDFKHYFMYSIEKIAATIEGNFINKNVYLTDIQHLLYDSRLFSQSNQTLFFALASQRNDGQKYIKELYQKGIRHFVVQNKVDESAYPEANIIFVKNTRIALQR